MFERVWAGGKGGYRKGGDYFKLDGNLRGRTGALLYLEAAS
jgi:hypothetical protein